MRPIPRDFPGKEPWRSAAWAEACRLGVTIEWSNKRGYAFYNAEWRIRVPTPSTWKRMVTFLHECGHQDMHRESRSPSWLKEIEASVYVILRWVALDLPEKDRAVALVMKHVAWAAMRGVRAGADIRLIAEWRDFADDGEWARLVTPWILRKNGQQWSRMRRVRQVRLREAA